MAVEHRDVQAPGASDEAVREAARSACADEFIALLPEGYATLLGERGAKLSTGQRQRISLARALVKQPQLLILDEPTASLDGDTERRVLENLRSWAQGRLVFLVTHRLATVRHATKILVLADGCITEQGTHEELLARSGRYLRMLEQGASGAHSAAGRPHPSLELEASEA